MRTAPVELLTQAEIFVDTGAAIAEVPARSAETRTPKCLREDMETSGELSRAGKLVYVRASQAREVSVRFHLFLTALQPPAFWVKLGAYLGALALMGWFTYRGILPRTRPILPGEQMVAD
jgi:hypothetical protein